MKEIWKDIPGYEGLYQVSNLGNVKSLDRLDSRGQKLKGRILKPGFDGKRYLSVKLYKNLKGSTIKIHNLVAKSFLRHITNGTQHIVIDHIDNNPLNNRVDNLQLISQRKNSSKEFDKTKTSSKYTGVTWDKNRNKWMSRIKIDGKQKHLGRFDSEYQAHLAYQEALKELT